MTKSRGKILEEAHKLVYGPRQEAYGKPEDNFARVAAGWSVLLGSDVTPAQVALCMAWLKMCRLVHEATDADGYTDGAAYIALAGELAGAKDMQK